MTLKELEKVIPFDQFSRQYQVSVIIDNLRTGDKPLRILDVGGYKGRTADFLHKDDVTVLDLYEVEEKNYIKGSALEMPFKNGDFDYVLSFDVLEHIPSKHRNKFFDECSRVAKEGVIICAPNKTAASEAAEASLNDLHISIHNKPHPWLKEHIEYGIPDFKVLEKYAASKKYKTVRFNSNKIQLWLPMQQAIFINSKYNLAAERLSEINHFYNNNFKYDGGGFVESAYRSILCCLTSESNIAKLKKLTTLEQPIDASAEIALFEKIAEYNAELATKQNKLAEDYKGLYAHEKTRAETLQANGEVLWQRVNGLEAELVKQFERGVMELLKQKASRNMKGKK